MKNIIKTTNNPNNTSKPGYIYNSEYYSANKWMLSLYGQWPYQTSREKNVRLFFPLFLSFSLLVAQTRPIIFTWGQLNQFAAGFSPWGTNVVCLIKLFNFIIQKQTIRDLLDETESNWKNAEDPTEINILKRYGKRGRIWSVMWIVMVYGILAFWLFLAMLPKILDAIHPLNESRKTFDAIPTDYGVDHETYWWWIQLHIWTCSVGIIPVLPAIDGLYIALAQHVGALFEISRCNLESIIQDDENGDVVLKPNLHEDIYYHKVVYCIKKHKILIQLQGILSSFTMPLLRQLCGKVPYERFPYQRYIKKIAFSNEACLLLIVGLNMVVLSVTGYQVVAKGTETEEAMRYALYTFGQLFHLFVITLPGHWIMEYSSCFLDSVYSCRWYMMSLRTRKLIMVLIRASIKPCVITAGKVYVMSIENFCAVLRTSMSYLTMLTSMQ